jgi:hypothetical protein
MALCSRCKAETELYDNGVPICLSCANAKDAKIKQGTRAWAAAANGNGQTHSTFGIVPEDLKRSG